MCVGGIFICGGRAGIHSGKALRGNRNDFASLHLQNLLVVEQGSHPIALHKKNTPMGVFYLWWTRRDSNPGPTD